MQLVLEAGGRALVSWSEFDVTSKFSESCTRELGARSCADTSVDFVVACAGACGNCECDHTRLPHSSQYDVSALRWTRTAMTIRYLANSDPDTNLIHFAYCVNGDRMALRIPGLLLTLRRAAFAGAPVPCGERALEDCAKGTVCRIGECRGRRWLAPRRRRRWFSRLPASLQLGRVSLYGHRAADVFGGGPPCGARVRDFEPGAVCGGTPRPCSELTTVRSLGSSGCQVQQVCKGPSSSVTTFPPIGVCDSDIGCAWLSTGPVTVIGCVEQTTQARCKPAYGRARTDICAGSAAACATDTLTACTRNPGCAIEGTRLPTSITPM